MPDRLVLFDVDATLIVTRGAGIRSMAAGARDVYGPWFRTDGVEYAGRLDPLIFADMLRLNALEPSPGRIAALRRAYARRLGAELCSAGRLSPLPGVEPLLAALFARPDLAVGLLTGNFERTGAMKLRGCGIEPRHFHVRVWGDESPHWPPAREHLPPIAVARFAARFGVPVRPERVVVVGDTPYDVACARASGCRSLGVATGRFDADALAAAGADLVLEDLRDTAGVLGFLDSG